MSRETTMSGEIAVPPINNLRASNRREYALRTALQIAHAAALGSSPACLTILSNLPEYVGKIETMMTVKDEEN